MYMRCGMLSGANVVWTEIALVLQINTTKQITFIFVHKKKISKSNIKKTKYKQKNIYK